jgi:uncharacterized protein YwqG
MLLAFLKEAGTFVLIMLAMLAVVILLGIVSSYIHLAIDRAKRRKRRANGQRSSMASHVRGRMTRMARPTLLLTPTREPRFSKLGGEPELPPSLDWPAGEKEPRAFLAQADLAEVHAAGGPDWLPDNGRMYAFYDDYRAGFSDYVRILFSTDPAGPAMTTPSGVATKLRFPERRADFLALRSLPSLDWLGIDPRELDDDEAWDELSSLSDEPFGDELQHRIGGYPSEIQEEQMALSCEYLARALVWKGEEVPPAIERASKTWRLLLQIDSDPALKMNWGDGGRLYVFIREKHARAGDFSKTVTLFQCY